MGKIRITQIGGTGEEEKREKRKVQREEKKKREGAGKKDKKQEKIHLTGMKGGERVKTVGADSEEELEKLQLKCPDSGHDVILKQTRRGKIFYGCGGYPKCKWMSWSLPQTANQETPKK